MANDEVIMAIRLRPMVETDLSVVERWLGQSHVARWFLPNPTVAAQLEKYRSRVAGEDPATVMLIVVDGGVPVGWCQWYPWDSDPEAGEAMGAQPGEVGIDYALGDPDAVGRGVGTKLIAALVAEVRRHRPAAGVLANPDAENGASRRVLERNGFELVAVRPVASEPSDRPMAIYRLGAMRQGVRPDSR
jgi:aminoglycoside 6'-N-acetyltransferase